MKAISNFTASLAFAALALTLALAAMLHPPMSSFSQDAAAQTDANNGTQTSTTNNNNTSSAPANASSGGIDCNSIASQLGGMAIPNPTGVCDVTVPIEGLEVTDNATGTKINQLLVINPIFEFAPIPGNNSSGDGNNMTGAPGQGPVVYGFAEIGASEDQLPSVMRMLSNSTWNVVAVHNHVVMESPKMMFVHATGMSDINTLTSEAKMVLDNLASLQQTGSAASNNGGSPPPSGAEQGPGPGQPTNQDQSASD